MENPPRHDNNGCGDASWITGPVGAVLYWDSILASVSHLTATEQWRPIDWVSFFGRVSAYQHIGGG
jgi:hypothetical protein